VQEPQVPSQELDPQQLSQESCLRKRWRRRSRHDVFSQQLSPQDEQEEQDEQDEQVLWQQSSHLLRFILLRIRLNQLSCSQQSEHDPQVPQVLQESQLLHEPW
jgi:hypothetical protein